MKKLSVYRTFSFWFCLGMAWVNLVMLLISVRLHNSGLAILAALTIAVCMFGAWAHWYLERTLGRRQ